MNTWKELLKSKPVLVCAYPVRELVMPVVPSMCEAVELRLDYLDNLGNRVGEVRGFITEIVKRYPIIVTIRSKDEGGANDVDYKVKLDLLGFSKSLGALIDVESQLLIENLNDARLLGIASNSIVSRHVFNDSVKIRDYLERDLGIARKANALVYKVFTVRDDDYPDMVRLIMDVKDLNVAIIPMKPRLRASAMLLGTALMYCSFDQATAPGQLSIEQCVELKRLLRGLPT